jgi:hypothetical protein
MSSIPKQDIAVANRPGQRRHRIEQVPSGQRPEMCFGRSSPSLCRCRLFLDRLPLRRLIVPEIGNKSAADQLGLLTRWESVRLQPGQAGSSVPSRTRLICRRRDYVTLDPKITIVSEGMLFGVSRSVSDQLGPPGGQLVRTYSIDGSTDPQTSVIDPS